MIIDDTSPEYDYNNISSFSVTFEEQYDKLLLDKVGPILYFQIRYHVHEDMDDYQLLILKSSVTWTYHLDIETFNINSIKSLIEDP